LIPTYQAHQKCVYPPLYFMKVLLSFHCVQNTKISGFMIVIGALRLFPAVFCHNPNRPLQKKNENGDSLPKVNLQRNLYNIKKLFMKKKKKAMEVIRDYINLI